MSETPNLSSYTRPASVAAQDLRNVISGLSRPTAIGVTTDRPYEPLPAETVAALDAAVGNLNAAMDRHYPAPTDDAGLKALADAVIDASPAVPDDGRP